MKRLYYLKLALSFFLLLININIMSGQEFHWVKDMAGELNDQINNKLSIDKDKNIYLTTNFVGYFNVGDYQFACSAGPDFIVSKYKGNGELLWAKHGKGTGSNEINDVCIDSLGNVYIAGNFTKTFTFSDVEIVGSGTNINTFLMKLNSSGEVVWYKASPIFTKECKIIIDDNNSIVIVGRFAGTLNLGEFILHGVNDQISIALIRYDLNGEIIWAKEYTEYYPHLYGYQLSSIQVNSDGDIFVLLNGYKLVVRNMYRFSLILRFSSHFELKQNLNDILASYGVCSDLKISKNLIFCLLFKTIIDSQVHVFNKILLLDSTFNQIYVNEVKTSDNDYINGFSIDNENNSYIYLKYKDIVYLNDSLIINDATQNNAVIKFNQNGKKLWHKLFKAGVPLYLSNDNNNDSYLFGNATSTSLFDDFSVTGNHFIAKLSENPLPHDTTIVIKDSIFCLYQNYPNPFSKSTTIKFELSNDEQVSLKVFNILGQEVDELINEKLSQGEHLINWNPKQLASGVYFYWFQTINRVIIKKMCLIR